MTGWPCGVCSGRKVALERCVRAAGAGCWLEARGDDEQGLRPLMQRVISVDVVKCTSAIRGAGGSALNLNVHFHAPS